MAAMATNDDFDQSTPKEKGLIKNLSKRNYQLSDCAIALKKAKQEALNMIWDLSPDERSKYSNIFTYLEKNNHWEQAYLPTKIGEYLNKKGIKSLAHFSQNDKYIGSVKSRGDKPFYILTFTRVYSYAQPNALWTIEKNEDGNVYLKPVKKEGIVRS